MKLDEVKKIAAQQGIKTGKLRKADIIKAIQRSEGNPDCYNTGQAGLCGQATCSWRDDCDR